MPQSFIAGGDIFPMRIVKLSTTVDGRCLQSTAGTAGGDRPIGISQRGTRRIEYVDTSGKAAAAGEPLTVYDEGEECYLETGGAVTAGDLLKSDANGKGITAAFDTDWCAAVALTSGASGALIIAKVQIVERSSV